MLRRLYLQGVALRDAPPARDYLSALPVVRYLAEKPLEFAAPVTIFVGENGVGKSTLIEAIAVGMGFNAEGGTRNFSFATEETHSVLYRHLDFTRGAYRPRDGFFLRAESFYNVATYIEEIDRTPAWSAPVVQSYGGKSLHAQSHGESFLSLVRHRFGGKGFYVLDEPEAALSPASQMELLAHFHRLAEDGSQILLATHSPILMTYPNADLRLIDEEGIRPVDYRETAHYQLTRRFLQDPAQIYRELFREE